MARDHDALPRFLEANLRTGFAWDDTGLDCVRFAAGAVEAQTGRDPIAGLNLRWRSRRQARDGALKRLGGLEAAVDAVLAPVAAAMAQRGDIALVETETGPALMVVEGETLAGPGLTGLVRLPRSAMTRAWSADL